MSTPTVAAVSGDAVLTPLAPPPSFSLRGQGYITTVRMNGKNYRITAYHHHRDTRTKEEVALDRTAPTFETIRRLTHLLLSSQGDKLRVEGHMGATTLGMNDQGLFFHSSRSDAECCSPHDFFLMNYSKPELVDQAIQEIGIQSLARDHLQGRHLWNTLVDTIHANGRQEWRSTSPPPVSVTSPSYAGSPPFPIPPSVTEPSSRPTSPHSPPSTRLAEAIQPYLPLPRTPDLPLATRISPTYQRQRPSPLELPLARPTTGEEIGSPPSTRSASSPLQLSIASTSAPPSPMSASPTTPIQPLFWECLRHRRINAAEVTCRLHDIDCSHVQWHHALLPRELLRVVGSILAFRAPRGGVYGQLQFQCHNEHTRLQQLHSALQERCRFQPTQIPILIREEAERIIESANDAEERALLSQLTYFLQQEFSTKEALFRCIQEQAEIEDLTPIGTWDEVYRSRDSHLLVQSLTRWLDTA